MLQMSILDYVANRGIYRPNRKIFSIKVNVNDFKANNV
jgi:hypothetical protein